MVTLCGGPLPPCCLLRIAIKQETGQTENIKGKLSSKLDASIEMIK